MFVPVARLIGHSADVTRARISPSLESITTVSADRSAFVWDSETGKTLRSLSLHGKEITDCVYHGSSYGVFTSCMDGSVRLFDLRSSNPNPAITFTKTEQGDSGQLTCVSVGNSPNSPLMVTGTMDGFIRFFDIRSRVLCISAFAHYNCITSLDFSPDDSMIVSASLDTTMRVWSAYKGDCLMSYNNGNSNPSPCVYAGFTADSTGVIGLYLDSSIQRMDLSDRLYARRKIANGPRISTSTKTFARIDKSFGIAVPSEDGSVFFVNTHNESFIQKPIKAHADDCLSVDCRGDLLVSTGAGEDSSAVIWVRHAEGSSIMSNDYKLTYNLVSPQIEGLI
jgi:COMPASS component SWD3